MASPPAPASLELGDPAQWVDRYGDALLRFACLRVGRREMAEDLVQETFLAAYQARHEFDQRAELGTWLVAILRRKIVDHYRRSARSRETAESDLGSGDPFDARGKWRRPPAAWGAAPQAPAEQAEFWTVLRGCLEGMPQHLAEAFELRELGAAPPESAASLLGVSAKNLAVRLHRARLSLRQCLERKWFRAEPGASE